MSPFDKAQYDALAKGLEIGEVTLKELVARWDAEFYTGKFARYCRLMKLRGCTNFGQEAKKVVKGAFDITADQYRSSGVPFVRIANLGGMKVDSSELAYIDEETHAQYLASELHRGDILLSKTAYAAASIVTMDKCNSSQDTIAISLKSGSVLDPYYTVVYLNTVYGLFLMGHLFTGNIQSHFNLPDYKEKLLIPVFSGRFQSKIREWFEKALEAEEKAKKLYRDAEQQLLSELGFADWKPNDETISVKKFSDSITAGRFDAEYFQPKYDELFALLGKCATRPLGGRQGLVEIRRSMEPGSDVYSEEGIPFVRITDFSEMGIAPPEIHVPPGICLDSPRPKKDTILLSKDGSVGIAYKVEEDLDVVTSGGILHLTVKDKAVLPDYLTLVLNSRIVRMQAERDAGGSIIQHWKPSEIERVRIPLLPLTQQQELAAKVQSSFALRAESKRLLDLAKHVVETAIEQGEEKAIFQLHIHSTSK